jgi:putative oxidoreductase
MFREQRKFRTHLSAGSVKASHTLIMANFVAHATEPTVLVPLQNGGELPVLYCFLFLLLCFTGADAWSIDATRSRPLS